MNEDSQFCVNIFTVCPANMTEATCPKDLFAAHECCKENNFNVIWIQEEDCLKLKPCKEDVFMLAKFSGDIFEYLRGFKCTIIGPQCLLVSIQKGEPLPDVPSPVFTVAMKGLTVTSTGFNIQEKKNLSDRVQFMGGKVYHCYCFIMYCYNELEISNIIHRYLHHSISWKCHSFVGQGCNRVQPKIQSSGFTRNSTDDC